MSDFFRYNKHHHAFFKKYGEPITFAKGDYVVSSSADHPWVYFLNEGLVKIAFQHNDGAKQILGFFVPGLVFAQTGSFLGDRTERLVYQASQTVSALRLPRQQFLHQIRNNKLMNIEYLSTLSRNQVYLVERIGFVGEKTVHDKLIAWLKFMVRFYGESSQEGVQIPIPLTQEDIASFLCITRESANNALRPLLRSGDVIHRKKILIIPNLDRL